MTMAIPHSRRQLCQMDGDPSQLTATAAASAIRERRLSAATLLEACLARIAARDGEVHAFTHVAVDAAREQAFLADKAQSEGRLSGPLHGLPVGVKDVFDTIDMPSEYGSSLLRHRRPAADAAAVAMLRRSGAIIIGKTTTSEFGMYHPSATRNPSDLGRSPGVSSAGSAAAVVDRMVPLALGTQHTASTVLPASFCGAHAFKPSFGFASMEGSNILVPRLAQIGYLARSVQDLCLFAGAFDPVVDSAADRIGRPPRLAVVRGPGFEQVAPDAGEALTAFIGALPVAVHELDLPSEFGDAIEVALGLLNAHLAARFGDLPQHLAAKLCPPLRDGIAAGIALGAKRYIELNASADRLIGLTSKLFAQHDVLVTLSAPGEATRLDEGPGSGSLAMPWSLCGLPVVSLPLLCGAHGLPIGLQLIGRHGSDRELLQSAAWIAHTCRLPTRVDH
ncbi:amidase [Bradyrhizobium sp. SZCCHNRI1009]|uniref:amidase n=1 Tax=Bradyrhizobium sp. SZCCHNRI1009 TaxID=3057277 RepID=UPI002916D503|nr:amidase [Bradyrhizobium sp. SZCCHNRI1009]